MSLGGLLIWIGYIVVLLHAYPIVGLHVSKANQKMIAQEGRSLNQDEVIKKTVLGVGIIIFLYLNFIAWIISKP
jgi:hypothetical protein